MTIPQTTRAAAAARELNRKYIIIFSHGDIEDGREVEDDELAAIIAKHTDDGGLRAAAEAAEKTLAHAIKRLETVAYRLRCTQRAKEWTKRSADADIIELEVITTLTALRAALAEPATKPL